MGTRSWLGRGVSPASGPFGEQARGSARGSVRAQKVEGFGSRWQSHQGSESRQVFGERRPRVERTLCVFAEASEREEKVRLSITLNQCMPCSIGVCIRMCCLQVC